MAHEKQAARSATNAAAGATGGPRQEAAGSDGTFQDAAAEQGRELAETAAEQGRELKAQAREKKDEVLDKAEEQADRQLHAATGRVHAVAEALRTAGRDLDGRGEDQLASLGRQAADQIERLAGYLDDHDTRGLLADLEAMARNNPGVFLGSTFAGGLAAGRFLRSSVPEPEEDAPRPGAPYETDHAGSDRQDWDERGHGDPSVPAAGASTFAAYDAGAAPRSRTGGPATSAHAAGGAEAVRLDDATPSEGGDHDNMRGRH